MGNALLVFPKGRVHVIHVAPVETAEALDDARVISAEAVETQCFLGVLGHESAP